MKGCILLVLFWASVVESKRIFKSHPVTVKPYENETVLLPCYFEETETPPRVKWYMNGTLLGDTGNPNLLLPMRIRMHANYSLQIDWLGENDTADYTCEVIRPEPLGIIKQTHSISVLCVPKIRTIPEDGYLQVKKGQLVDIGCDVTGTPTPTIEWKKNGEAMALLDHRSHLKFRADDRFLSGKYECIASNGVGDPVSAYITLLILDAPVVTVDQAVVHGALGYRVTLCARMEPSLPFANTYWLKEGAHIRSDDRVMIFETGNIYRLVIRFLKQSDFGNYTFRADNKVGMTDVVIRLSGVPNAPSFIIDQHVNKVSKTGFTLVWETEAYSTIVEYHLWIRQYFKDIDGNWKKLVVPGDDGEGPIHTASFNLTGLHPSTTYEAIVSARNMQGWSSFSPRIRFATEPGTGRPPSTENYSEITPHMEEPEPHNITTAKIFKELFSAGKRQTSLLPAILGLPSILLLFKYEFISCFSF